MSGLTRYPSSAAAAVASAPGLSGLAQGRFVGVTTTGAPTSGTFNVADFVLDQNGQTWICVIAGAPGSWVTPADIRNMLTVGQESYPREYATASNGTSVSGTLKLVYFTARKSETSTQVRLSTGGVAAATATLCRIGLYSIAANGDGTQVAATTNDTTLFIAANTSYSKVWASSYAMVAGQRYAIGHLVLAGTMPTWCGQSLIANGPMRAVYSEDPRSVGAITGLSDLPASYVAATPSNIVDWRTYFEILP